jgi:hypothetical protein
VYLSQSALRLPPNLRHAQRPRRCGCRSRRGNLRAGVDGPSAMPARNPRREAVECGQRAISGCADDSFARDHTRGARYRICPAILVSGTSAGCGSDHGPADDHRVNDREVVGHRERWVVREREALRRPLRGTTDTHPDRQHQNASTLARLPPLAFACRFSAIPPATSNPREQAPRARARISLRP